MLWSRAQIVVDGDVMKIAPTDPNPLLLNLKSVSYVINSSISLHDIPFSISFYLNYAI
ncbi:hypothetical protein Syun_008532 [Stephania yunnanensis]|uniref:Uncharacterized protein n=1 Tax=Stephania yunnanensis TaxID=152371 RepID=A0AAP0KCT6_9MAGN